jgi:hypothetical protein
MLLRKAVPRAYLLANVATEYPMIVFSVKNLRYLLPQFNGKIRYAFAGIKQLRTGKCLRWAGIKAPGACATIIADGTVIFQFYIRKYFCNEK